MPQTIAVLGTGDANTASSTVPQPILDSAVPGIEPVLTPVPGAVFPGTPEARLKAVAAYTEAGIASAEQGHDAIYINTVGDYGLRELRSELAIPVVGAGEAAIRAAINRGHTFSIVTLWPPTMSFIYQHIIDACSASDRCRRIHFLSESRDLDTMEQPGNAIVQMQACEFVSMQTVKAVCRQALAEDRCDVLVLGCTCMADMAPILEEDGFPLIEPMRAGYLLTATRLAATPDRATEPT